MANKRCRKLKSGGLREASENMGFGGCCIKWKQVTPKMASKALGDSHGMSKSLWDKLYKKGGRV